MPKVRAKTIWVDRWEKTPARTAQDKIKRRTPAGSSLAGVLLFCTNLTQPTGNLDSRNSQEIMELLKLSNKKYSQTLVMITHDENLALQADRIIAIEDGRIARDEVIRR